jgi:chromate reductase
VAVGVVVAVVCDGCAPGVTEVFDDEPHAASASTAAKPTPSTPNFFEFVFMQRHTARAPDRFTGMWSAGAEPYDRPMEMVDLVLISGSLQRVSANRALLDVAARCAEDLARVSWYDGIGDLPHLNLDLIGDDLAAVVEWRAAVTAADGVLIASPEYAHSLPGSLKNALDWLVGTGELYDKPVGLMSAGTSGGERALAALAQTLNAQGSTVVGQLSVPGVRPKLDEHGNITDLETIAQTCALVEELVEAARRSRATPPITS